MRKLYICRYCGKEWETTSSGKTCHEAYCKENPNRKVAYNFGMGRTEEEKRKISRAMKGKSGGYRYRSGRGKKGWYKGYYCDSSWELAYVVYNIDHNISFIRNENFFPYVFKGEKHNYKPDFIEGETYIEIKGYVTEQVIAKESFFEKPLIRLDKITIKPYLDYAIDKYGKNFWEVLYENRPIKKVQLSCSFCQKTFSNEKSRKLHEKVCLLNSNRHIPKQKKICSEEEEKRRIEKDKNQKKAKELGKVDSLGRVNFQKYSMQELISIKNRILSIENPFYKKGWKNKVSKLLNIPISTITYVVNTFPEDFNSYYQNKAISLGEKNGSFGTCWITNGIENKKIKKEEIIPEEWHKGRIIKK